MNMCVSLKFSFSKTPFWWGPHSLFLSFSLFLFSFRNKRSSWKVADGTIWIGIFAPIWKKCIFCNSTIQRIKQFLDDNQTKAFRRLKNTEEILCLLFIMYNKNTTKWSYLYCGIIKYISILLTWGIKKNLVKSDRLKLLFHTQSINQGHIHASHSLQSPIPTPSKACMSTVRSRQQTSWTRYRSQHSSKNNRKSDPDSRKDGPALADAATWKEVDR